MNTHLVSNSTNTVLLNAFPLEMRPVLRLISEGKSPETVGVLVQFIASFVHPDYVCNLSLLNELPDVAKAASFSFFEFCLKQGLTLDEQGALLAFTQPHIVSYLGGPLHH